MTVSCRDRDTPLVVSELPAQRRLAVEPSSAMTMQSPALAAASARSTNSWGDGGAVVEDAVVEDCCLPLAAHAPASSAVLRILMPRMTTDGHP